MSPGRFVFRGHWGFKVRQTKSREKDVCLFVCHKQSSQKRAVVKKKQVSVQSQVIRAIVQKPGLLLVLGAARRELPTKIENEAPGEQASKKSSGCEFCVV